MFLVVGQVIHGVAVFAAAKLHNTMLQKVAL
jgi:hypothetical protein